MGTGLGGKRPGWWIALALLGTEHAIAAGWIELHPPSTARLTRIAAAGSTLFAGSDSGLMYRSSDAGLRWERGEGPKGFPVRALLVDGMNVYAARSDIYNPLYDCFSNCIYPRFISDLIVSRDGGATWKSDSLRGVHSLARGRDGTLWAMGGLHVYRLPAGETQWIRKPFRLAGGSGGSTAGGRRNSQGLAVRDPFLLAVFENRLVAANIMESGDTVSFVGVGEDSTFALAGDSTLTLVADRGGLWLIAPTLPKPYLTKVNTVRLAWLTMAGGVLLGAEPGGPALRSLDGGVSWNPIGAAAAAAASSAAVLGSDAFVVAPEGEVLASRNSGAWRPAMTGIEETHSQPLLVAGGRIYAKTFQGLRSVPAGGGTWDSVPGIPAGTSLTMMAATTGWLWAAGDGLWRGRPGSTDAWEQVIADPVYALAAEGKRVIAALDWALGGGIYSHALLICDEGEPCRGTAAGQLGNSTLALSPQARYSRLHALVVHGDTLMATDKSVYRSVDGGKTWDTPFTLATDGGTSGQPYALSRMLWSGSGLLATLTGGQNCYPCLYRSSDLGATWDRLAMTGIPYHPRDFLMAGGRFYSTAAYEIYSSPDAQTWSPLGYPGGPYVIAMQADEQWMAVSGIDEKIWSMKLEPPVVGTRRSGKTLRAAGSPPPGTGLLLDRSGRPRRPDGRTSPR